MNQRNHKLGHDSIVLVNGPYAMHIFVGDGRFPDVKFPAEPASACAPLPCDDGPIVYVNSGKLNMMGCPIFVYREINTTSPR